MMTSSNGNIVRVTGHLCGEFTGPRWIPAQRPVTQSFDVFFDLRLNKRLSKQSWGWWFETLSRLLWRHRNAESCYLSSHGTVIMVMGDRYWVFCRHRICIIAVIFFQRIHKLRLIVRPWETQIGAVRDLRESSTDFFRVCIHCFV